LGLIRGLIHPFSSPAGLGQRPNHQHKMRPRIYNLNKDKQPAELFRKDLISAMKLPDTEPLDRGEYWLINDTWKPEWERGVQVPVNPESVDRPSTCFRTSKNSTRTTDKVTNDASSNEFRIPKKLMEAHLDADAHASAYDLDLMDLCWLQSLRQSEESVLISESILTRIINQLEIQCATNMKAKQVGIEYDDQVLCDVCRSPDAEDNNEMVFCDSCNICVHQACYGITNIPSGEWLCKPCKELGSQKNVSCLLCPNVGGALKPTTCPGKWAHVSCALWIPEVSFESVEEMEPITKVKQIPPFRKQLLCCLCGIKKGAPIQCSFKKCKTAYHITCAFKEKLKMQALVESEQVGVKLKSFCFEHSSTKSSVSRTKKSSLDDSLTSTSSDCEVSSPTEIDLFRLNNSQDEETHCEFWKYIDIGEIHKEFIPALQVDHPKQSVHQLQLYIDLVLQYWKLKRYSRYGAPLIKLTANASIEEIQQQQRNHILRLRVDLERIRNLSYMLIKREKLKRTWLNTHKQIVQHSLHLSDEIDEQDGCLSGLSSSKSAALRPDEKELCEKTITLNNIYTHSSEIRSNYRSVMKRLNQLALNARPEENHSRPNPYARLYAQSRRSETPTSTSSHLCQERPSSSASNGQQTSSNQKLPLRNKAIPSNSKNSASNTHRRHSTTECDLMQVKSKLANLANSVNKESSSSVSTKKVTESRRTSRKVKSESKFTKNLR
jgi:hypothetical protein